ncbi:hypothetical protein [Methanococcus aeolicus]|uniref:hypothetical protein n=1 Tax=Methanococcus aeolicus TaxID=42879 RepID=UPI0021C73DAA|nr:hypothetical protein [Methanococcus aeolicus]UXM84251.1 hypothetical protein N6C89_05690 [Methanococcus aeolicus]
MALKSNLEYWEYSLKHLEPIFEKYYIKDNLIVENKELIEKVERLRELIISYCVIIEKNEETANEIFKEIYEIINSVKDIKYTEFVAFWKALDMSYSVFEKVDKNNKEIVLKEILAEYCKRRRKVYDKLGYSNITIQALYDSGSSRKQGNSGGDKLNDIVRELPNTTEVNNINDFKNEDCCYFLPDKTTGRDGNKGLFKEFIKKYNLNYEFGENNQNKIPDMVLKINDCIFVIEAKHIKENGGAQNKQITELIEFITYQENTKNPTIHYVSFLDGIYFNKFIKEINNTSNNTNNNNNNDNSKIKKKKNKIQSQIYDIETYLRDNKNNFFVNTEGFKQLLEDIK